jgi:thioesterase domain-containing protein/aryl carrier-like protein
LELLEVSASDFDATQPLMKYGLDSIGAAKLASILRPYGSFSQMQLLAGATWSKIEPQLQCTTNTNEPSRESKGVLNFEFPQQTTQPLVQICSGPGTPTIIVPGGNGTIGVFFALKEHFVGPLWALQVTETTPQETFEDLVGFWKRQITEKVTHGPCRLASFSLGTVFGVALAKMLEDAGNVVVELIFIDHCPALWAESDMMWGARTAAEIRRLADNSRDSTLGLLDNDPAVSSEILASYRAGTVRGLSKANGATTARDPRALVLILFRFLQEFYRANGEKSDAAFNTWLSSVKASLVLLVAEHGIVRSEIGRRLPDLGASRLSKPVRVHYLRGVGHFGLFGDEGVAQILAGSLNT